MADALGLKPVCQVADDCRDRLNIRIIHLDEPDEIPYHPGRLLNEGLQRAQGAILSTMDADQLVPPNFLTVLDHVHHAGNGVAYMHRYAADRPCGVKKENWIHQIVDYQMVLNICLDRNTPIPETIENKAPLLSARRENWEAIEYYDAHPVFSTAYTLFGADITARFRMLLGDADIGLPVAAVHPWHPTELDRDMDAVQILYQVQKHVIEWSLTHRRFEVTARRAYADGLYQKHQSDIERAIRISEHKMMRNARPYSEGPVPGSSGPSLAESCNSKGEALFTAGETEKALAEFTRILACQPDDPTALNNVGVVYWQTGELATAANYFQRALKIDPGHQDSLFNLKAVMHALNH